MHDPAMKDDMADRVGDSAEVRRSLGGRQPRLRGGEAVKEAAIHQADRSGQATPFATNGQSEHAPISDPLEGFLTGSTLHSDVPIPLGERAMPVADPSGGQGGRHQGDANLAVHHGSRYREGARVGVGDGGAARAQARLGRGVAAECSAKVPDDASHLGLRHSRAEAQELERCRSDLRRDARSQTSREQQRPDQRAHGCCGWESGRADRTARRQGVRIRACGRWRPGVPWDHPRCRIRRCPPRPGSGTRP